MDIVKKIVNLKKVFNKKYLYLHEPSIDNNEKKYLFKCIDSKFVSTIGSSISKFENQLTNFTNSKFSVALNSGTSALHLALKAIDVKNSDEIILPSATFVGSVNPILYMNADPVFVDIELDSYCICPIKLKSFLKKNYRIQNNICINRKNKKKLKAIIYVNLFGNIGNILDIKNIADSFKLKLIEDSAEALGSFKNKIHAGLFGDIGTLSFNGNKIITTGSGGAIITNNSYYADRIKHLSSTAKLIHSYKFYHDEVGYNYKMSNIHASIGLSQISKLKKHVLKKNKLNLFYKNYFDSMDNLKIYRNEDSNINLNYWLNILILSKASGKQIDQIILECQLKKIFLRRLWNPLHSLPFLKNFQRDNLDNTKILNNTMLALPSSSFLINK